MDKGENIIPAKIIDFNIYGDGERLVGAGSELELPTASMMTSTLTGCGLGGEIDLPTLGKFQSIEQELPFTMLHSSFVDFLDTTKPCALTFRGAAQILDREGITTERGCRVVERGVPKEFKPGKAKMGEAMDTSTKLELFYLMIEVDGENMLEIDKLNNVYKVRGVDQMANVRKYT